MGGTFSRIVATKCDLCGIGDGPIRHRSTGCEKHRVCFDKFISLHQSSDEMAFRSRRKWLCLLEYPDCVWNPLGLQQTRAKFGQELRCVRWIDSSCASIVRFCSIEVVLDTAIPARVTACRNVALSVAPEISPTIFLARGTSSSCSAISALSRPERVRLMKRRNSREDRVEILSGLLRLAGEARGDSRASRVASGFRRRRDQPAGPRHRGRHRQAP